jgi:hypothetical protein
VKRSNKWKFGIIMFILLPLLFVRFTSDVPVFQFGTTVQSPEGELESILQKLFKQRTELLLAGELNLLEQFYAQDATTGQWALESEQARIGYVREWAQRRSISFLHSKCDLSVVNLEITGDEARASVCPHILITYQHEGNKRLDLMGVRTIHWLELVKRNGQWLIQRDWFLDPFEGGRSIPAVLDEWLVAEMAEDAAIDDEPMGILATRDLVMAGSYNREAAVNYANKYSGVRLGPTTGRYNQAYRDYGLSGGDCANYASQVLADEKAGGLPQDWIWFYREGGGSQAWVQAEAFVQYFLGNGRAQLVLRGDYQEVTTVTPDFPLSAVRELQPGDVIGYELEGQIAHVSVVVGQNSAGYIVVNCHSADRFQVPWDLGYDQHTVFWLVHIRD